MPDVTPRATEPLPLVIVTSALSEPLLQVVIEIAKNGEGWDLNDLVR